jgi:hypothetical protein
VRGCPCSRLLGQRLMDRRYVSCWRSTRGSWTPLTTCRRCPGDAEADCTSSASPMVAALLRGPASRSDAGEFESLLQRARCAGAGSRCRAENPGGRARIPAIVADDPAKHLRRAADPRERRRPLPPDHQRGRARGHQSDAGYDPRLRVAPAGVGHRRKGSGRR